MIKHLAKRLILSANSLRRPSVVVCAEHDLLPELFVELHSTQLREALFLPPSPHATQLNQDVFALLVNRFQPGYFVEIGANDGFTLSNTVYLEQEFNWGGLLIEANPGFEDSLKRRQAKTAIAAVTECEGHYQFRSAGLYGGLLHLLDDAHREKTKDAECIPVWGSTLEKLLLENDVPSTVDFISIDVEGAEVPIVQQLCQLSGFRFTSGCIEHNSRQVDYERISQLLTSANYKIVWEGKTQHDLFFVDRSSVLYFEAESK